MNLKSRSKYYLEPLGVIFMANLLMKIQWTPTLGTVKVASFQGTLEHFEGWPQDCNLAVIERVVAVIERVVAVIERVVAA